MAFFALINKNLNILIPGILLAAGFIFYLNKKILKELHSLQLNSYMNTRYLRWYTKTSSHKFLKRDLLSLPPLIFAPFYPEAAIFLTAIIYFFLAFKWQRPEEKKPLVMTARAKRLYACSVLLAAVLAVICLILLPFSSLRLLGLFIPALLALFPILLMLFANLILAPVERNINAGFFQDAQNIIAKSSNLTVIGITGSFGKTSCKMVLGDILGREFTTLVSPKSYNTPMGLTRVIRESLRPIDEIFVAEMGAKQKGDIALLCSLVKPKIGILTAIGEQHLETFGSLEQIIKTKFELIEALPKTGLAILNFDNKYIKENASLAKCPVLSFGIENKADYSAKDINYNNKGLSFTLCTPDGGSYPVISPLLGRHNIYNILAATACAGSLGMPIEKICREIKRLNPVEHRLQLIKSGAGYAIIDDAFNSNPAGAKAALEVLATIKEGKKIIITPGMIELGPREYQLNREFALEAAGVCDYIILVGKKRTKPMQDALEELAYPPDKVYIAANLDDARGFLAKIVSPKDTVLFENDLPDTYNEG